MGYCTWAGMNEANRIYHDTEWGAACQWHAFSADRSGAETFQCMMTGICSSI